MHMSMRHHTLLATMIGAALAAGMIAPAAARQPVESPQGQDHGHRSDGKDKADAKHRSDKDKADRDSKDRTYKAAASRDHAHRNAAGPRYQRTDEHDTREARAADMRDRQWQESRQDHRQDERHRMSERDQHTRVEQQRGWMQANIRYQQQAHKLELQRAKQLQQANRNSQYRYQQAYYQRLNAQRMRLNNQRYDYRNNPYFSTADTYRYSYGGRNYTTNQYGAEMLRQAVNYGYQEGLRAGHADRADRTSSNYRGSYAYQDASYGYDNYYVDRQEYTHYFREGFQRGYNDGYGSRRQYGTYSSNYLGGYDNNGSATILQAVLGTILNLQQMDR